MKDVIKFLATVANGKINPSLGFIRVNNGIAQAGDSSVFVQMDCDLVLNATMKADRALSAVNAIKGDPKVKQTEKSVIISGGGVRVTVPTISNDDFPNVEPSGDKVSISGNIIPSLNIAKTFSADGDVREYLNGVAIKDGLVMASNGHSGVILDGVDGVDCILPKRAIDLLVKIGEEPEEVSSGFGSITFYYQWGWVRCNVIDGKFPDMTNMLIADSDPVDCASLTDAVNTCKSVVGNSGKILIDSDSVSGDDAVTVDYETGLKESSFNCGLLSTMLAVSDTIAISDDPRKPAIFSGGHGLRGLVAPVIR